MPTQTKFIAPSGAVNLDLSGIFADLDGGTSYGTATKFKVGSVDLTGYFHASTGSDDRPNFNTGYKITVNGATTDLSAIFRRRGFSGINITVQPQTQTKNEGENCTFSITATTLAGTLTYQWKKWNGSSFEVIQGAESSTYQTPTLVAGDDGNKYICTLSNGTSTLNSAEAVLTVYYVTITTNPSSNSYNALDDIQLSVGATTKPTSPVYLWQYSPNGNAPWTDQNLETDSTIDLIDLIGSNDNQYGGQGYYRCRVTNGSAATVTKFSQPAYIQVYYAAVISEQPQNAVVVENQNATFSISANGKTAPTYRWQELTNGNWVDIDPQADRISGETSASLVVGPVIQADEGRAFRCIITNNNATGGSFGNTISEARTIIVADVPSIVSQPSPLLVNDDPQAAHALQVTAAGTQVLYFQWFKNGASINQPRHGNLTPPPQPSTQDQQVFNPVNSSNIGNYFCRVTNIAGQADTQTVSVAIITPIVSISSQDNQTQFVEGAVSQPQLSSSLTQGTNVTYQWRRNGVPISGATSATYNFSVSASNTGTYSLRATNNGGFYDSGGITISIIPPTVTALKLNGVTYASGQNAGFNDGDNIEFSVNVNNAGSNLSYQWFRNSVLVGTNATYSISLSSANDQSYYCTVTNGGGSSSSGTVNIVRYFQNTITSQPVSTSAAVNGPVSFQIAASGFSVPTYQWQRFLSGWFNLTNDQRLSGAQASTLTITGLQSQENGSQFRCIVSNLKADGSAWSNTTSSIATLTVLSPPTISGSNVPYGNYSLYYGNVSSQVLQLIVYASGTGTLSYQWFKNSSSLGTAFGANTSTFTKSIGASDGGTYFCNVTNNIGTTSSGTFIISVVNANPTITFYSASTGVDNGSQMTFYVSASAGGAPITYQWRKNGVNIANATSSSYVTSALTTLNDTDVYTCYLDTGYGNATSQPMSTKIKPYIIPNANSSVTQGPFYFVVNQNVANFTVSPSGSGPFTYQWQKSTDNANWGSVLSTVSNYSLGTVSHPNQSGYYRVTVSSVLFGITYTVTATAQLTVQDQAFTVSNSGSVYPANPMVVYNFTDNQNIANFYIVVTGGTNLQYVWYKAPIVNNAEGTYSVLAGYTTSQGPIYNKARVTDSGYYRVVVSNGTGSVTATVRMNVADIAPSISNGGSVYPANPMVVYNFTDNQNLANFFVTASGTNLQYVWYKAPIVNDAEGTYSVLTGYTTSQGPIYSNARIADAGYYRVVVSNTAGSATATVRMNVV